MASLTKTDRTTMSRLPERASYDRELAFSILDEGLVAHVGFDVGHGVTVIPMTYAREGENLYLHGAVASGWLSAFEQGHPVCVTVTLLDGMVLAQSAFSHSMNYRSIVAFGTAHAVTDGDEKALAFKALVEHLVPGRWEDCKQPDRKESNATVVLRLPIEEASIKVRAGAPKDSEKDLDAGHWTGVIPFGLAIGEPEPDPVMTDDLPVPEYVTKYRR